MINDRTRNRRDRKTIEGVPPEIHGGAENSGLPYVRRALIGKHLKFTFSVFRSRICNSISPMQQPCLNFPIIESFPFPRRKTTQKGKGKEIMHKVKEKVGLRSSTETGKGNSKISKDVTHGYYCVKGKAHHPMEDYAFADFKQVDGNELGLFAIFDGHLSTDIPNYLKSHLFDNIISQPDFWTDTESAIKKAYRETDEYILGKLQKGGSTAVTAILINCRRLVVANVGDSRAVVCRDGKAEQLSVDHEPEKEEGEIEARGGCVIQCPGDVARVDGELAVARAFGDKSLKEHLSSDPDVVSAVLDDDSEFAILASDGIWHVMTNQEAVDCIKTAKDAKSASKELVDFALSRRSIDDISVIVVKFR